MKKFITFALIVALVALPLWATAEQEVVSDTPTTALSLTTGLPVSKPDRIMVAQMDNEPGARPQKGIASADIVYEIELYNGGYTRYTAVFNDTIPTLIEAVRSTRIVNVDFYLEYGGCFIHFGGQKDAGSSVYDYFKTVDMQARYDGLSDGKNFYRDSARTAPNNVICKFQQIYDDVDWDQMTQTCPLTFSSTDYTLGDEPATAFEIDYRSSYEPSYLYDVESGLYKRYYNGKEFKDGETGEQITCSNVIVQYVAYDWYDGKSDRPKVTTTGTNRCDYFIGGTHFTGYWVRDSLTQNTTYYDDAGNQVVFKPGKTFIQTSKDTKEVTITE